MTSNNIRYVILMVIETAAAMFLFYTIFPIFRQVITQLGEPQDISPYQQAAVACGAPVLQACYWVRFRWVAIPAPFRNALVRHLFPFASRVSFFFGGALFSVFFSATYRNSINSLLSFREQSSCWRSCWFCSVCFAIRSK
ncbi:hypothetical protein OHD62_21410 [Mesorhizobium sp. YC-39]|uniref:hypothetical protein n=1 Tax=unclassified Mesorhizobium TaxID=325217 RepID=UPI0021E8828B|nr:MULTISPECIES: hypothetical protein [unclassified Mesorhizobium]MCV3210701.1 hypothetical protein [Mesorhizobium sp. YC-2]MCV3230935.1 hypothetical protein [Mesorhizobium sp. YC-39]